MKQNNYKPQLPDVMEAIFDTTYLIFDLVLCNIIFIYSNGDMLFILYGILTLTLCGGGCISSCAKNYQSSMWK